MAATVQFIAGSNKETYVYQRGEKFTCASKLFGKGFKADDVLSVELQPLQNTATTGSAVAGAVLGGVALGSAGMIAGALIGGKKGEALVTFYFKDGGRALGKCNAPMLEALQALIFEGKIREGNPYAGVTMEQDEKPVETAPQQESATPGAAPHNKATTIPVPPKGMTGEFGSVKAPKKKGGIGKKVLKGIGILFLLCVISAVFGEKGGKTTTEGASSSATAQQPVQKDPCAGITMEEWNKASKLWRMANPQCNPEKQKSTSSEAIPNISKSKLESYLKKALPTLITSIEKKYGRDFGLYAIVWPQFGTENGKNYAVQITFSKSITEPIAQELSTGLVLMTIKGLEDQGVTLKAIKQHDFMLLGGAAYKRSGKLVSYGAAAAMPADNDEIIWISQYEVQ